MVEISEVIVRLPDYVSCDTQSGDDRESTPSTRKQFELAHKLVEGLKELGASQIRMSGQGYAYACTPSNLEGGKTSLALGFITHIDTAPPFSGKGVKSQFIRNYDGQDICPSREQGIWVRTADFPDLEEYEDETLTTTDGTALLGADDKAGIAGIMTVTVCFLRYPEVKHETICIGFTPGEEAGRGVDGSDVENFGVNVAYTMDGGALEELKHEDFSVVSDRVTVHGANIYPGTAKGRMRNTLSVIVEFRSLLPVDKNPMHTEGYEGFYHPDRMTGYVEEARMGYIIGDHDRVKFGHKKELFAWAARFLNRKYSSGTVEVAVKDSYYSMKEKIEPHVGLTDKTRAPTEKLGIRPVVVPIRESADSARLSYMGLSCPNLCIGGYNFHGKYEFILVQSMEKITELLIGVARFFVEMITDDAAGPCLPDVPAL